MTVQVEARRMALVTAGYGALVTAAVVISPSLRFAYRGPEVHLVLETAEGVIALVTAYLIWGRFRLRGLLPDVVLVFSLLLFGLTNLFLSVVPNLIGTADVREFSTWAPVITRMLAAGAFMAGAFVSPRHVGDVPSARRTLLWASLLTFLVVGIAIRLLDDVLPTAVETVIPAAESKHPRLSGHAALLWSQGLVMVLFALAAWGFVRRSEREQDGLWMWFGAAAVISAFARFNYLLFPSIYSQYVYTGDVLRLAFYLTLLAAAVVEIHSYWRARAAAAVLEERQRLAGDLHDGVAQELVFIAGRMRLLARRSPEQEPDLRQLMSASDRAVSEARRAISALKGPIHQPLDETLREVATDLVREPDISLELELESGISVSPSTRESLVRIMREAIRNSLAHAHPRRITVQLLDAAGLRLRVSDDGAGFEPEEAERSTEGFGIETMRGRARSLGAEFIVDSQPHKGTTVEVRLP